jgi:transposase-like protein
MSAPSDCPNCGSHDIRELKAAVIGVSGFRCHACAKIFYVASEDVKQRIHDAQTKHDLRDAAKPKRRTAGSGTE